MNKNQGFTLIELLVVVLIIGILSAVALPQYQKAVMKARVMGLMPLIRSISDAENLYYLANGTYTLDFSDLSIEMPAGGVQEEPHQLNYNDFYCKLRTGGENDPTLYSVYCNSNYANAPEVEKYFTRKEFSCWARSGKLSEQVCQSISGRSVGNLMSHSEPNGYSF